MRVIRIGGVILDNPMSIKEATSSYKVSGEAHGTIAGGVVFFERVKEPSSFTLTLESGDYGWQKKTTVSALITLSEQSIGEEVTIELEDATTKICRFRYEVEGGACVAFEPRYEGGAIYKGNIYLGVVR